MMILLTGGSGCGKSTFAESLAVRLPAPRYYIAAMQPYDAECLRKIARHREMRKGKGFETIERQRDMEGLVLPDRGTVLLECLCNLTANEMFLPDGSMQNVCEKILYGLDRLRAQCENLIIVTNDVGSETEDYSPETRAYITALGNINRAVAEKADAVCELVCGIPILLKGSLPE